MPHIKEMSLTYKISRTAGQRSWDPVWPDWSCLRNSLTPEFLKSVFGHSATLRTRKSSQKFQISWVVELRRSISSGSRVRFCYKLTNFLLGFRDTSSLRTRKPPQKFRISGVAELGNSGIYIVRGGTLHSGHSELSVPIMLLGTMVT